MPTSVLLLLLRVSSIRFFFFFFFLNIISICESAQNSLLPTKVVSFHRKQVRQRQPEFSSPKRFYNLQTSALLQAVHLRVSAFRTANAFKRVALREYVSSFRVFAERRMVETTQHPLTGFVVCSPQL
jgi:hypothetical protein